MEQEQLIPGPHTTARRRGDGLYKRYVNDDGTINVAAWLRAVAGAEVVGTCREDGGDLHPGRPTGRSDEGTDPDYPATCATCGKEVVAVRGRTLRWKGNRAKRRPIKRDLVQIARERSFGPASNQDGN